MLPASHEEQMDGPDEPGKTCGPKDLSIKDGYWAVGWLVRFP